MTTAVTRDRLERYYRAHTSAAAQIGDFTTISDGWETEVCSFTLNRTEALILRMYPGANAAEECEREFQGMTLLKRAGYRVPSVLVHETDAAVLGKPFIIMQKIDGLPLGRIMREHPAHFPELLTRFVALLVDLHRIDLTPFNSLEADTTSDYLLHKLANARTIVRELQQDWTAPVLDWLDAGAASITPQIAVTHNDFHPWNILISADNSAFVIDWSGIAVGDYRDDLGWTLLLSATQGSQAERDLVLSEYERLAGHPVDQIEYFEAFAALRRLFGFAASLSVGAESVGMRPEAAAIMRGQHERFRRVYAVVQTVTGLRLPEIERLLDSLAADT